LSNITTEIADSIGPVYTQLIELLSQQAAVHLDETCRHINGDHHWL
jgi:hypothetical protein